jgi:hypothetical protein
VILYFQVLEPQVSSTNVAECVNGSARSGTTVTDSESYTTVAVDSKSSVLNVDTCTLTNRKLSVTDTGMDQRVICRLQMSLDDVPLVNITDNVIHPVKNSVSLSVVDVGTADVYSINGNLQKSIFIPLKIQVTVLECYTRNVFLS